MLKIEKIPVTIQFSGSPKYFFKLRRPFVDSIFYGHSVCNTLKDCDWRGQWRGGNLTCQSSCPHPACPQISMPLPRIVLKVLLRTFEAQLTPPPRIPFNCFNDKGGKWGEETCTHIHIQQSRRDHYRVNKMGRDMGSGGKWGPEFQSPLCL